ncbi:hypothetical protein GWI33_021257 [Rhynchophorus ferrugineus]|uniref:Uncharacterized protein n=1 Tax=Rhynchophorus ferrugineus TaxID=354439 RepID=A0A834HPW2_RHYFE|nr:hypothetical protein GWI33_021257 [Rhynchophorus ferrugineus]
MRAICCKRSSRAALIFSISTIDVAQLKNERTGAAAVAGRPGGRRSVAMERKKNDYHDERGIGNKKGMFESTVR